MIQIEQGSIFDAKCDLLVIPCNSDGGVTPSVFLNLKDHGLPTRIAPIAFGDVYFKEVGYENAAVIAYAASVDIKTNISNGEAIKEIAHKIQKYCQKNSILAVNVPLLGSGAGGMSAIESYKALQKEFEKDNRTTYKVYCYTRENFQNVSTVHLSTIQDLARPRVFISYTGNDVENASWVKSLATTLRQNGIDARLDAFHLKPGTDLPQWMTNEVILANKVLLVCDSHYMEKSNHKSGGVGWETMIIQGDMLAQGDNKQKYIAIIREDDMDKALPIYIRSKYALDWGKAEPTEEQLKELILHLFNCDTEPELGNMPDYVREKLNNKSKFIN